MIYQIILKKIALLGSRALVLLFIVILTYQQKALCNPVRQKFLRDNNTVSGQITNLLGTPVKDATVRFETSEKRLILSIQVDNQGEFTASKLQSGTIVIFVIATGFATEKIEIELSDNETQYINVGLIAGQLTDLPKYEVFGEVRYSNGQVVGNATITVFSPLNKKLKWQVKTSRDGKYKISVDTPGQFYVLASKANYVNECFSIILQPPQVKASKYKIDFSLRDFSYDDSKQR